MTTQVKTTWSSINHSNWAHRCDLTAKKTLDWNH